MPKRNSVPPLKSICLSYVSSNINIWRDKGGKSLSGNVVCDDNLIVSLPKTILDNVIENAIYQENVRPRHLNMLLHQHSQKLDLMYKSRCVIQRGIELICNICKNLKFLRLSNSDIDVESLKIVAKSIPRITSLHLHSTATTDDVLSILGENCPNLRELNVSQCSAITNTGVIALCKEICTPDGRKNGGQCRLIRILTVRDTSITDEGASVAICHLPYLRHFDYSNILGALEQIYKENNFHDKFKLETIYCNDSLNPTLTTSMIHAAAVLCPNIKKIKLLDVKITDEWFIKLADFPRLTNLTLNGLGRGSIYFRIHVEPLLNLIGSNLKSLSLECIKGVDLRRVGYYCSQLTKLRIFRCYHYLSTPPLIANVSSRKYFAELEKLDVVCFLRKPVLRDQLECLLCNCHRVRSLRFSECQSLTDDLLSIVYQKNSFSELSDFSLVECNKVKISSILWFVNNCESLKILSFMSCVGIQTSDYEALKTRIRRENLNLLLWR